VIFGLFKSIFKVRSAKAAGLAVAASATIYAGFELNQRSLENLRYISPDMQEIVYCASKQKIELNGKPVKFVVYHGLRSEGQQRDMIAKGVSWVNRSRHQDGKAVDVMAVIDNKGTWDHAPYHEIAKAFYACGKKLEKPVTWGGEWRVKDMVHFEISKGA
jgi:peptidoglycan LD-endopeptidase CwlK